jgi:mannose-6-phosphate isomerase-like protein (cupin superfamily)
MLIASNPGDALRPLTDEATPTAFLALGDRRSLLRRAADRLTGSIEADALWAIVGPGRRAAAVQHLPDGVRILEEDPGTGSVGAFARVLDEIRRANPGPVEVLLQPTTHAIGDEAAYRCAIEAGLDRARSESRGLSFAVEAEDGSDAATGIQAWPLDRLIERLSVGPVPSDTPAHEVLAADGLVTHPLGDVGWIDVSDWAGVHRLLAFVEKPWGHERLWALTRDYAGKVLFIRAGETLSLQYHERKDETIRILSGRMALHTGTGSDDLTCTVLDAGESFAIPPRLVHRMEALEDCTVIEVSTPQLADVVRLKDRYGRV